MVKPAHIREPDHFTTSVHIDSRGRARHVYACTLCETTAVSYSAVDAYAQIDEHYLTYHREVMT